MIDSALLKTVRRSYGSLLLSPNFTGDFYRKLFAASPEIAEKFKNTNLEKQKLLFAEGINFLIMHAAGQRIAQMKLDQIATIHDRGKVNVPPHLYPIWVRVFLEVAKQNDLDYDSDVESAWKIVLQQGIDYLISKY